MQGLLLIGTECHHQYFPCCSETGHSELFACWSLGKYSLDLSAIRSEFMEATNNSACDNLNRHEHCRSCNTNVTTYSVRACSWNVEHDIHDGIQIEDHENRDEEVRHETMPGD